MIMTAAKPVHHQLKSKVGLFWSLVRIAGGGWPQSLRSRAVSIAMEDMRDDMVGRCAQPVRASVSENGFRNARTRCLEPLSLGVVVRFGLRYGL